MAESDRTTVEPTRRAYLKYGGAAVGGGLFAGCTGNGQPESLSAGDASTDSGEGGDETVEDTSYSVTMAPMGEVSFDSPPETWLTFLSTYGDMGIALGQAVGLKGIWDPDTVPVEFYEQLPGVDVSFDDVAAIEGLDKETLYELDCDLHLLDPNWLGVLVDDWSQTDTEEVADRVGPFLGNYIRRRGDDWHDYQYYSLYEAFEIVADAFAQPERYEAFASVHDDLQSTVQASLPESGDRPSIGLVSVNSDFEGGSFYVYPVQDGNNHKQYRDLEMRGAFDDHIDGGYAQWDYERLLEIDPDALLFQYGLSHVSAEEFESRMDTLRDDPVGGQLTAVQNDRLYRGGSSYQGPIINLFQTEAAAKQFYPDAFGEWRGIGDTPADEQLFDRQRVADIIDGER
ncbi:ferrichrome-binding protein [Halorubrum saccharovorum DSM 1137]|uniref:Ferrichrome-binding protein n=1 Tax=Halorubrum saccharovorum DSM 1137 TaxID=1227484 RepID=M0DQZ3_9EURY|nr:ABC transporter substrate-binding protein [Halorubrum saccharovorum]ELZ37926.1 ferrichrome-binding protein [Halorubrum saccharovorum DSM 1137]